MLEGVDDKVDVIGAYGMMNGVCQGMDVIAPDLWPWKKEEE